MILSHIYSLATDDQVITIYENTEHHAVYELGRGKWYEDNMLHLYDREIESFHWRPESITVYVKREEAEA